MLGEWAQGDPAVLEEERVREFFLHLVRERGYAPKTMRLALAALGGFYRDMLGQAGWKVFKEVRTKDRERLPEVLLREEVRLILSEVKEPRFATPLRLIYLCGLRLSEALHVEVRDIHRQQQRLHIREGKGGKDRFVPLPQAALDDLTAWWKCHRHPRYLFPAMGHTWRATQRRKEADQERVQGKLLQQAEHPMSTGTLQRVFQLAVASSGVKKRATIHTLRHSYATHLLEEGVSLRYISQYLGHASIQQTLVYAHLTAVSEAQTQQAVARLAATLAARA
jgi:integrase/recombinase XerD